jgi:hypothetical protein
MLVLREWKGGQCCRGHELDKFNVMLAADFTCYISPKGQTKGEWVNHLKSL